MKTRRRASLIFLIFTISTLSVGYVSGRCECVNKIVLLHSSDDFRIISSPEYPRPYCQNIDCIWRVVAPDNSSKAYFYADNLDLRDTEDRIIFYDHKFLTESDNETESFSCTGDNLCRFASSGQYLTIRFKTNSGLIDNYGFQGLVSAKDKPMYALLEKLNTYCIPILIVFLALLGVFVSIACCRRQKPNGGHISRHHHHQQEKNRKQDSEVNSQLLD